MSSSEDRPQKMNLREEDQLPPPPPSAPSTEAQTARLTAQALNTGKIQERESSEDSNGVSKNTSMSNNRKADGGLKSYFRVFQFGNKLDALLIVTCCITSIGSGITIPLMNVVFGNLVGNFTNYFVPGTTVTRDEFQSEINRLALLMVYLFIAKLVLSYFALLTVRISSLRISAAFRLAYLRALFAQPVSVIDTISPGKVSTRITTSANTVQLAIGPQFALLFQSLAFTIGLYVVAFIKGWLLTLVASASLPFILIVYGTLLPPFIKIHKITEKHHEDASALAYEIFNSIRVVVAFGAEGKLAKQHASMLDKAARNEKKAAPLMGLMMAPAMLSMYGTFAITFWFGIKQYTERKLPDIGPIVVVLFSVMMAVMNIGRLAAPLMGIAKASVAASELFVTIDAPLLDTTGVKEPQVSAEADITFEDVAFSYPSRPDVPILQGLNLRIQAGKMTAIVGPSGSGKSTIVGLIQRWYDLAGTTAESNSEEPVDVVSESITADRGASVKRKWFKRSSEHNPTSEKDPGPVKENKTDDKTPNGNSAESHQPDLGPNTCTGSIRIGTINLRDVDLKWWRSKIGLVQQEPFLFNDTIFNNVAFGLCGTPFEDLSREEKMKMVQDACREAYAEEFIEILPQGYDTLVGESGIKLSGGQRQRIAIARSIIKQPVILILDEATSAIDVRTERIVQQALDRVSSNRTTLVIAHRLSTIKKADNIVVLRHGKLVEQGSHTALLENPSGAYYGLVHAQELTVEAEHYTEEDLSTPKVKTADIRKPEEHEQTGRRSDMDPEYKKKGMINSFGLLLAEQRHHWILYSVAILGVCAAGAVYPLQAYIFAQIITVFTFIGSELVKKGNFWAGMFGVLAAGCGLAYFILGSTTHVLAVTIAQFYRGEYLGNMIRKRIAFFDDQGHSPGSLTSRLSADCTQLQQLMSTEMSYALIAVVNLIGSIIISFVFGWKLSLVGLFAALPLILAAGWARMGLEIRFESDTAKIFENSSQFATEAVGGFRTVLSLIMGDLIGDRYQTLLDRHIREAFASAKYGTIIFAASDSIELACMALTFWYGGTLLASREYDLAKFFIPYMAIIQGAMAAGMWFSFAPNMAQATGAANRILSMRTAKNDSEPTSAELPQSKDGVSIEFRSVDFTYNNRDVPVLSKLNLSVQPGQFAALVGASGCGKSTTISLLEKFYDVSGGQILFNGEDITTLNTTQYRQQLSLVSQEPTLYEGTIKENIALSVSTATDAQIQEACLAAQIHDFIISLPQSYNTPLGPKGMSLSGGQKQRISLARALLRNPKLLLLDEATSSLDSESEKLVQEAIERAAAGDAKRTTIAVAHRLATIQRADVIFVMGGGKVLESGDHQSLLKKRGVYWQMCQAQALDR